MTTTNGMTPLPSGHDDPTSPSWIEPELRAYYQAAEVSPAELESALDQRRAEANHADLLIGWQRYRDWRQARLDPSDFRRWLSESTHNTGTEDERPTRYALSTVRDHYSEFVPASYVPSGRKSKRPLTEAEHAATLHAARLDKARAQVAAERHAQAEAADRAARLTCPVCGAFSPSLADPMPEWRRQNLPDRACSNCAQLLPLLAIALEPLEDHSTRLGAVLDHLSRRQAGQSVGGVTPAQIAAWLDAPGDDNPLPMPGEAVTTDATQREEAPAATRLRRLFGGAKPTGE